MNRWIKPAAFLAVAATVAGLSSGAGATNAPTRVASAGSKEVARSAASTAAARRGLLLRWANLKTVAGVKRYLRAIGVDPRGVVIQRGQRNYAGPSCPGARWACTSTAHAVVQIAAAGGKNTFLCTTGVCAVVQATTAATATSAVRSLSTAAAPNEAKCIRNTGITQSCSISQNNTSANNVAIVVEIASKASGLTQTASSTAQIIQQATGPSNTNTACVLQTVNVDGSTVAKKGTPVTVTLEGHQSIAITQDARGGSNTVQKATTSGSCDNSPPPDDLPVVPLTQSQTLTSAANGSNTITQWENKADNGPNLSLDIEQNQSTPNAIGQNTAAFSQTNILSAIANTVGPVIQIQSSSSGGIQAKINQFSHGVSKAYADQQETQCEHAQTVGGSTCTAGLGTPPSSLTQMQVGPARTGGGSRATRTGSRHLTRVSKGPCCSIQGDNANDVFHVTQSSKQTNDTGKGQTNKVQGDCSTSGNCDATQSANINNQETTNTQSGKNVSASVTCTGTACTRSGDVFVSLADGTVRQYRPDGTLVRTLQTGSPFFVTGGAFDSGGNFYVTEFGSNAVAKFAPGGAFLGTFGSGYNLSPESIVFDTSGNVYVGQADGTKQVLKFDSAGNPLGSFAPATEDRGTDWIDLAADQCTLYYTSEDTSVKRFNVCTNTQLPDFATGLTGGPAFALRRLPDGTVLVADSSFIFHLDTLGQVVQSYSTPAGGFWFGLSLDPNGTSFWAANTGTADVVKFNIATAAVEASFNTGTGANTLGGVTVAPAVSN